MTFLYHKLSENFREFFPKSTVTFLEISGKIPQEISGNFPTYNHTAQYKMRNENTLNTVSNKHVTLLKVNIFHGQSKNLLY